MVLSCNIALTCCTTILRSITTSLYNFSGLKKGKLPFPFLMCCYFSFWFIMLAITQSSRTWDTRPEVIRSIIFFCNSTNNNMQKCIHVGPKTWKLVAGIWVRTTSRILASILVQSFEKPCKYDTVWRRDSEF